MPGIEELAERFRKDRFATEIAGAEIREAGPGWALCAMPLQPFHLNANQVPMGGAVFTLADFAYAVAANGFSSKTYVTQQMAITFLAPAKGKVLLAEARSIKDGRATCLYEVRVRDELGTAVAYATVNGFAVNG